MPLSTTSKAPLMMMAAKRKGGGLSLFEAFDGKVSKGGKGGKGRKGRGLTILNAKLNGGKSKGRTPRPRSGLSRVLFGEGGGDENAPLKRAIKKQLKVIVDLDLTEPHPPATTFPSLYRPTTPPPKPPHHPTTSSHSRGTLSPNSSPTPSWMSRWMQR